MLVSVFSELAAHPTFVYSKVGVSEFNRTYTQVSIDRIGTSGHQASLPGTKYSYQEVGTNVQWAPVGSTTRQQAQDTTGYLIGTRNQALGTTHHYWAQGTTEWQKARPGTIRYPCQAPGILLGTKD